MIEILRSTYLVWSERPGHGFGLPIGAVGDFKTALDIATPEAHWTGARVWIAANHIVVCYRQGRPSAPYTEQSSETVLIAGSDA